MMSHHIILLLVRILAVLVENFQQLVAMLQRADSRKSRRSPYREDLSDID